MTNNRGGYKLKVLDNKENIELEDINISGQVVDLETNEPLPYTEITIGCNKIKTSSDGKYTIKVERGQHFYLKASSIGYRIIETDFLNFKKKNSIQIDFFLEEDKRPLINCEGNI